MNDPVFEFASGKNDSHCVRNGVRVATLNVHGSLGHFCSLNDGIEGAGAATTSEKSESIGLFEVVESDSSPHVSRVVNSLNSSLRVDMSARARAACAMSASFASPCSRTPAAPLPDAVVAHAHASPLHDARNSVLSGGLLPVQKSTSYNLDACSQGPTGRRRPKGGVSGPAEDLRSLSEMEAGVNFRQACQARRACALFPDGDQDQEPGGPGVVWYFPSTWRFLTPNTCHLGADWIPRGRGSGCSRGRMLPANLDHLSVGIIRHGLSHARARLSVFISVWTWSTNQKLPLGWE